MRGIKKSIELFRLGACVSSLSLRADGLGETGRCSVNFSSTLNVVFVDRSLLGTMTRYTNVGWKRTYHQANFDPNDDQIARSTPSTPVPCSSDAATTSHAQFEGIIGTPAESNRKRPRISKGDPERKVVPDFTPAAIAGNNDKTSSSVAEKKRRKVLAGRPKLKTKEKTRRAKSP